MKPFYHHIILDKEESFTLHEWRRDLLEYRYRFQSGYALIMTIKGRGTRCLADKVERFQDRELVFFGPKVPFYYLGDLKVRGSHYVTATFEADFLSGILQKAPEAAAIRTFLTTSHRGLVFSRAVYASLAPDIVRACRMTGWHRLCLFLDILGRMATAPQGRPIASVGFSADTIDAERLSAVCAYVHENSAQKIREAEAAKLAGFSLFAFSRYFHQRMNRTFVAYVNEVRIGKACRSLVESDLTVTQIAFKTGYNNLSVFNNNFRKLTGVTPSEYREKQAQLLLRPDVLRLQKK